jgi:hypothetical protein
MFEAKLFRHFTASILQILQFKERSASFWLFHFWTLKGKMPLKKNTPEAITGCPSPEYLALMASKFSRQLVVYLSSSLCPFTGRVFAMEGPDVAIYTPWSVKKTFHKADGWDVEALAQALADHPPQAEHMAFFPNGAVPFRLPPGKTLKALARNRG